MKPVYIHYGAPAFNPAVWKPIHNRKYRNKPKGGLWASRKDASFGWKTLCELEDFMECDEENSFIFVFKDDANVVQLFTVEDLYLLPYQTIDVRSFWNMEYYIDFEECLRRGIDAIELCYYGKEFNANPSFSLVGEPNLYSELYGWECDSVIILNPDSIQVN